MFFKKEIYELLQSKKIPFQMLEHEAVYTMEDLEKMGMNKEGDICKNLFLRDEKGRNHYLVSIAGEKKINLKELASEIGSTKLSFASPNRLEKYLGVKPGSVSPLGILNDESNSVIVIWDQELKKQKVIGVHPNDNTASIWISPKDLQKVIEEHGNKITFVIF